MDPRREELAFQEKIGLAKLEVSKAEERVAQLEYELTRFRLEVYLIAVKAQEAKNEKN